MSYVRFNSPLLQEHVFLKAEITKGAQTTLYNIYSNKELKESA